MSHKQISKRVNGKAVMMYLLGLSYGAVQAVARQVAGMKQEQLVDGYKSKAVGADVTSVRCNGKWVTVGMAVDAINGMVLRIDELPGEDAEQLKAWLEPILNAVDADAFKKVSDESGRTRAASLQKPCRAKHRCPGG